jgi:hypothetical protein
MCGKNHSLPSPYSKYRKYIPIQISVFLAPLRLGKVNVKKRLAFVTECRVKPSPVKILGQPLRLRPFNSPQTVRVSDSRYGCDGKIFKTRFLRQPERSRSEDFSYLSFVPERPRSEDQTT